MKNSRSENAPQVQTSLEIPLLRQGDLWRIDLKNLPIFFGLSVLAMDIGDKLVSRHYLDRVDIEVEKKVKHTETPELAELQIENIKVSSDYEVLDHVTADKEAFYKDLIAVFGSLQMQRWRKHIYPDDPEAASKALVFPCLRNLPTGDYPFRVILERLCSSKKTNKYFLRAVIEGLDQRHLDLGSFEHVVVKNPEGRSFIAGSTRISYMLYEQIRWEARRGKRAYSEVNRIDSYIFSRLHEAGMADLGAIEITWTDRYIDLFRTMEPRLLTGIFKKILLLLEDHPVRSLLHSGETIRIDFGEIYASLDVSQLGRSLNICFGRRREKLSLDWYLERLPSVALTCKEKVPALPLKGVKILLIHHVTAEVLGLIAALKSLGADDIFTLFVHYGQDVPSDFLEALLHLNQDRYRCYSLNRVEENLSVEGYFVLSPRYSTLQGMEALNDSLYLKKPKYLEAMVRTATRLFLELLLRTIREDAKCLIVEDGGYLSPFLAERSTRDQRLAELLPENGLAAPAELEKILALRVEEILDRWLIGTSEHTKNGLDRLAQRINENGSLARPAFSIAISRLKVTEEAREVATSVLAATESVLHALGKVLSRRRALVMGSEGSIGTHLVQQLHSRCLPLQGHPCLEVDIRRPDGPHKGQSRVFATCFQEIPREAALEVDLILGVTGTPAFLWEDLKILLLDGKADCIYLASGSTKTVEFEDVSNGLERLLRSGKPRVRDVPCRITTSDLTDPQTRRLLGHRYRFSFDARPGSAGKTYKDVCFLGSLMPINFLYYGVPGEVFDPVLSQLLRCSLGLVRKVSGNEPLAKALFAVDHDIDVDGELLAAERVGGFQKLPPLSSPKQG